MGGGGGGGLSGANAELGPTFGQFSDTQYMYTYRGTVIAKVICHSASCALRHTELLVLVPACKAKHGVHGLKVTNHYGFFGVRCSGGRGRDVKYYVGACHEAKLRALRAL